MGAEDAVRDRHEVGVLHGPDAGRRREETISIAPSPDMQDAGCAAPGRP
jgi:hypothetical protein